MSKVVVTRATLLAMAQRCARQSELKRGFPLLDDVADLLEQASFRVAELEQQVERWESLGHLIDERMPRDLSPGRDGKTVLQGWTLGEYLDHVEVYDAAGVDLRREPLVGVGSICRRQTSFRADQILWSLASEGLRLHAFGYKVTGLRRSARYLASADSLAWSLHARLNPPLSGHRHRTCANCCEFALAWRDELLSALPGAA